MEKRIITFFSLKKILIGSGIFVIFAAIYLAQNLISAQAHVISVTLSPNVVVTPSEIKFGDVFPEEQLTSNFNVSLAQDCKDKKNNQTVTYSVVQKIKPKPNAQPPRGYQGTVSDYCQTVQGQADQSRCYLDLCPFLTKIPDSSGDTEATSTLGGSDKSDIWKVNFLVPDIFGAVGQDNKGGVISQGGDYGCDISIEIKEQPMVKTYKISGLKFEDKDGDGKLDKNEPGLSGWAVFLDANNNGKWDLGEAQTLTDKNGAYSFSNLPAGTYHVREMQKNGWTQTMPGGGKYDITFSGNSQDVSSENFGNFKLGSISGMKFEDKDGDGKKDKNESGLANWTIQLKKPDGTSVATTTDKDGKYFFVGLGPGKYSVNEVQQTGWKKTTKDFGPITIDSGDNDTGYDIGNTKTCKISGHEFDDKNNNGKQDRGEEDLGGWTVQLKGPDGSVFKTLTDKDGNYEFDNLGWGKYSLSDTQQSGWKQTTKDWGTISLNYGDHGSGFDYGNKKK